MTSILPWESVRMLLEGEQMLKRAPPILPLSHRVEASDTSNAVQDLRDDMDSLEGVKSQMGASPKMPLGFMHCSQLPSEQSNAWALTRLHCIWRSDVLLHPTLEWLWGREEAISPHLPMHGDMFQEGLEEQITEDVVLAPGEPILFFGWWSCKKGLPLGNVRDVGFSLTGPIR